MTDAKDARSHPLSLALVPTKRPQLSDTKQTVVLRAQMLVHNNMFFLLAHVFLGSAGPFRVDLARALPCIHSPALAQRFPFT